MRRQVRTTPSQLRSIVFLLHTCDSWRNAAGADEKGKFRAGTAPMAACPSIFASMLKLACSTFGAALGTVAFPELYMHRPPQLLM